MALVAVLARLATPLHANRWLPAPGRPPACAWPTPAHPSHPAHINLWPGLPPGLPLPAVVATVLLAEKLGHMMVAAAGGQVLSRGRRFLPPFGQRAAAVALCLLSTAVATMPLWT